MQDAHLTFLFILCEVMQDAHLTFFFYVTYFIVTEVVLRTIGSSELKRGDDA